MTETETYDPRLYLEFDFFVEDWCDKCQHDNFDVESGTGAGCLIMGLATSGMFPDDDEYPPEIIVADDNAVLCTAYLAEDATGCSCLPLFDRKPDPKCQRHGDDEHRSRFFKQETDK